MPKTLLGIALFISFSSIAFAEPTDDGADLKPPQDGWRSNVMLGVARFPSSNMDLGTGVSASVLVGREWVRDQLGLQVGLELEAESFGHVLSSNGDLNLYSARPTVRLSYYAGHWMPYAELGVGYTYASAADASDNMLAIAGAAGVSYRFTDRLALGAYVRYEPDFEPALNQFVDFGLAFNVLH
ncbi:MAG: outer membrane beta-barrel protein [Kofleriaceae bacterium]